MICVRCTIDGLATPTASSTQCSYRIVAISRWALVDLRREWGILAIVILRAIGWIYKWSFLFLDFENWIDFRFNITRKISLTCAAQWACTLRICRHCGFASISFAQRFSRTHLLAVLLTDWCLGAHTSLSRVIHRILTKIYLSCNFLLPKAYCSLRKSDHKCLCMMVGFQFGLIESSPMMMDKSIVQEPLRLWMHKLRLCSSKIYNYARYGPFLL